jgi:hypothetical protein
MHAAQALDKSGNAHSIAIASTGMRATTAARGDALHRRPSRTAGRHIRAVRGVLTMNATASEETA